MLFIVLYTVVTTFPNFQATFHLICPKIFEIFTPNFTTKVRKILLNLCTKITVGWKYFLDDVVDHVRHF